MTGIDVVCKFEDCSRSGKLVKGYCQSHYYKLKRRGELPGKQCEFEGCKTGAMARGKCSSHYAADRRNGLHDAPLCSAKDCVKVAMDKGLCSAHAWRRDNDYEMDKPLRSAGPWRDWEVTSKGYVRQRRTNEEGGREWQWQHRIVMEQTIGRPLERHEEVHHRNGDRADNSPSNLQLWSTKQPKGQHWSDKLDYALEIIKLYGPLRESGFDDGECAPHVE